MLDPPAPPRTKEEDIKQVMSDIPEEKTCEYAPCSRTFRREGRIEKVWLKQRFCTPACGNAWNAKMREQPLIPGAAPEALKVCAHERCGRTFVKPVHRSWKAWETAKYCSAACTRLDQQAERDAAEPVPPPAPHVTKCKWEACGKEIVTSKSRRPLAYCSDECRSNGRRKRLAGTSTALRRRQISRTTPSGLPRPVFPGPPRTETWRPPGWSKEVTWRPGTSRQREAS